MVNKNLRHVKSFNVKKYEDNGRHLEEVTKWINVELLKVEILRQRTPKLETIGESYAFYKIIKVIKYTLKMKVGIIQNDQKETCSVRRDLHRYIRFVENGARM